MGGERPPAELVKGGIAAGRRFGIDLAFVGDTEAIHSALRRQGEVEGERFSVLRATQVVSMDEPPVRAVRAKRDSSLVKGLLALQAGEADALVSPGNTGAVVAGSIFTLGRIARIPRPGIAVSLPSLAGDDFVVIDVGANVDCAPEHLVHFALMGATYARDVLGRASPRIGLLNIGTEKTKGNKLNYHAYEILQQGPLPFAGNVEPHRLLTERPVDVVVCDGFVGNILLKAVEGGVAAVSSHLRRGIARRPSAKIGALFLRPVFAELRETLSYERRGGAPLLGVDGIVVIAHGRSDAAAIDGAIDVARRAVEGRLKERLEQGIGGWDKNGG